jgi:hypothetical protein
MENREDGVMKMIRESEPNEADLFERPWINHFAWTSVILLCALVFWMALALVNAENQRNALANKGCRDRVFKEEVDKVCLLTVQSREHWWEHLIYAMRHTSPEK